MSESMIPAAATNAFTKKIGPLPGFAWVLIVVGIAYGVFWWRKRGAAGGGAAVAVPGPSAVGFEATGPMPGTGTYNGAVNTMPVGQAAVSTNAQWAKTVANFLIGTGSYSATDVSNALSKYMGGQTLTDAENAIINTAVKQFQVPPEGVMAIKVGAKYSKYIKDDSTLSIFGIAPDGHAVWIPEAEYLALGSPAISEHFNGNRATASKSLPLLPGSFGVTSGQGQKYTAHAGETLGYIAQRFYGNSDTGALTAANPSLSASVPLTGGEVLTIP